MNDKDSFLAEEPVAIMKKTKNGIPWMTGVNSDEGLVLISCKIHMLNLM